MPDDQSLVSRQLILCCRPGAGCLIGLNRPPKRCLCVSYDTIHSVVGFDFVEVAVRCRVAEASQLKVVDGDVGRSRGLSLGGTLRVASELRPAAHTLSRV